MNTSPLFVAVLLGIASLSGCGEKTDGSSAPDVMVAEPAPVAAPEVSLAAPPADVVDPPAEGPHACGLDSVSNVVGAALAANPSIRAPLVVGGWYFLASDQGAATPANLRAVPLSSGAELVTVALQADRERADIAKSFGDDARMSGFRTTIDKIAPGSYRLEVVFDTSNGEVVCARSRTLTVR
jgi:hypothetical protein